MRQGIERRTQILKGALDLCVLAVLADGPTYGYALVAALQENGLPMVAEGSIYPLLSRLSNQGYVHSYFLPSPDGPKRKYYELTNEGEHALREGSNDWLETAAQIGSLLGRTSNVKTAS